jgi:hypothetical protein
LQELELILPRINTGAGGDDISLSSSAVGSDDEPVSELVVKLLSLLEDFDVDAAKVAQQIKLQISDPVVSDTMAKIEVLLGEYDFEGALELAVKIETA